jgi:hypothetical protein
MMRNHPYHFPRFSVISSLYYSLFLLQTDERAPKYCNRADNITLDAQEKRQIHNFPQWSPANIYVMLMGGENLNSPLRVPKK